MKTSKIREYFLNFFKEKDHKIFPSDSLVPQDKTSLFTSAGMQQFKPYFLGEKKGIRRAASCQKCLRTDDLEKVGKTSFHHTFFEMLGNFSFGDYFKKEAIEFAWEFLTKVLNLPEEHLWISVYREDEEAFSLWKDYIGVSGKKIVKLGMDKNFWPANAPLRGPEGPCGPCSEIFFDKGENYGCKRKTCSPACSCGRFVEVWNLVFTQFNYQDKKLLPLSQKNIDTGMGLERIASILQNKDNNFQIDIFSPVVEFLQEILSFPQDLSFIYAVADHIRAVTFAICDGIFPSNEERGYVIRKLIRKALYHGFTLGKKTPFLYKLVPLYVDLMKDAYPELEEKQEDIASVILAEEERFLVILKGAEDKFAVLLENLNKERIIKGEDVFKLYDTYGVPLEVVQELATLENVKIDEEGFKRLFEERRRLSQEKSKIAKGIFTISSGWKIKTEFVGYENLTLEAEIVKLIKNDQEVEVLKENEEGVIILEETVFYPESGGQLSDKGEIKTQEGLFQVEKVEKINETIFHKGRVKKGKVKKDKAFLKINEERRKALERAHTATHLLQAALRKILGTHVTQQGSLVDTDRLRFDFTHFQALKENELEKIERLVNEFILQVDKVETKIVPFEEAKKEKALAFFEEKYEDLVRVVSISDYSKELCGGTHVKDTGKIGLFLILSESSVSSGIRRIEAVCGKLAQNLVFSYKYKLKEIAALFHAKEETVLHKVREFLENLKEMQKKLKNLEKLLVSYEAEKFLSYNGEKIEEFDIDFFFIYLKEKEMDYLLFLSDALRKKKKSLFFLISSTFRGNIFVFSASSDLVEKGFSTHQFITQHKKKLSLKGGGKDLLCRGIITKKIEPQSFKIEIKNALLNFLKDAGIKKFS
ncbi:MAG: alanine--tRNA ligase [Candidatus Omnitrophica bacterium 4484_70.1]|nr:MAG: alanine--tRNA ligase [Candidatus Omnitrophica bacterium 4484_70.1]